MEPKLKIPDIKIRFSLLSNTLKEKPTCIVFGETGSGKTSLCNKLCGTSHKTGDSEESVTRNLYRNDVICGDYPFQLIDTPGTDSDTDVYEHAFLLKSGLTAVELNTLFIVAKYDNRFTKIREEFLRQVDLVEKSSKNMVLLISHWDLAKNTQDSFTKICKIFDDHKLSNNIIFYSENNSSESIANLMYSCICNMKPIQVEISETDFFAKFEISSVKKQMSNCYTEFIKEIKSLYQLYYNKATESAGIKDVEEKDDVLHFLIINFKQELVGNGIKNDIEEFGLLGRFQNMYQNQMNKLDYYTFYIEMRKECLRKIDQITKYISNFMSYSLLDNTDPRNLIKQCPNPACGLIWFKTEGCDGETVCGRREFSNFYDYSSTPKIWYKYIIKKIGDTLKLDKSPPPKVEKKTLAWADGVKNLKVNNGVGCKNKMVWGELPKLPEETLLKLFSVSSLDQVKELIKGEKLEVERIDFEKKLDVTFKI